MKWVIGYKSGIEFWRKASAVDVLARERLCACKLSDKPLDARELYGENPLHLENPLHVLVGSSNARKETRNLACHIDSRRFPEGSFIRLSPRFVVSSPELCFVHMAGELPLVELVMLGFELCGGYRLEVESESGRGFRDGPPLTSVTSLESFVAEVGGSRGIVKARRALRYIIEGSASPMETILAMLLTLPYKLGGYGFSKPLLNAPIYIQNDERGKVRKPPLRCDLYWPDEQVAVEYDSDTYHAYADKIYKDAVRRNALSSVGVTVVTVSRRQVVSVTELRKTAEVLSKLLERRLQYPMPEFAERHAVLRSRILPKVSG